jgi:hypothetical protein
MSATGAATPVEVSTWVTVTTWYSFKDSWADTISGVTEEPHFAERTSTLSPLRSQRSMKRSPKKPLEHTSTFSPFLVMLAMAISMARVPEPATTNASPLHFQRAFKSETTSAKSATKSASPKATVSRPIWSWMERTTGVGPGIITSFWVLNIHFTPLLGDIDGNVIARSRICR